MFRGNEGIVMTGLLKYLDTIVGNDLGSLRISRQFLYALTALYDTQIYYPPWITW